MPENTIGNYSSICNNLSTAVHDIDVKIRLSEQNEALRATYNEQLQKHESNIMLCNGVIEKLKPMLEDTQTYINDKRAESMFNINNALRLAGEIIPDAAKDVYFKMDGDEAWLSTKDDLTVQNTEGGAFRQVSSAFIRSVVLGLNPDFLQTMFLDEVFAHVSVENTANLSLYLNVLCQDRQVICIEQKPEISSNIDATVYHFTKGDMYTQIERYVSLKNAEGEKDEV